MFILHNTAPLISRQLLVTLFSRVIQAGCPWELCFCNYRLTCVSTTKKMDRMSPSAACLHQLTSDKKGNKKWQRLSRFYSRLRCFCPNYFLKLLLERHPPTFLFFFPSHWCLMTLVSNFIGTLNFKTWKEAGRRVRGVALNYFKRDLDLNSKISDILHQWE